MHAPFLLRYFMLLVVTQFIMFTAEAQSEKADTLTQLLDYSRPGPAHQHLAALQGNWDFQDTRRAYVKGVLVRTPIFDGRFYAVEITGGKLQVPIANGAMKEDNYRGLQWEGYDNARKTYITTSINNHIGSDEEIQQGLYDSTLKVLTYESQSELLPGLRVRSKRIVKLVDANTYTEEYLEESNGQWNKVRELRYTRHSIN